MFKLLLIAGLGGFFGTCCRFLVNRLFTVVWKEPFPLATFTINIIGCLLIGILIGYFNRNNLMDPKVNALLVVGFCGGFTTFSTFALESFKLGTSGEILISFLYIAVSIIAGLFAVWLGLIISR